MWTRISMAVSPRCRRQGVARALVQRYIEDMQQLTAVGLYKGGIEIEAWVVNPMVVQLLEDLGFESEGDWDDYNPYMRRWV